jgi:hypothetical protein
MAITKGGEDQQEDQTALQGRGDDQKQAAAEEGWRGATAAGAAQSPALALTSTTTSGTGELEAMRRACCTKEAVPAPPGKATTSTEAMEVGEEWATAWAIA